MPKKKRTQNETLAFALSWSVSRRKFSGQGHLPYPVQESQFRKKNWSVAAVLAHVLKEIWKWIVNSRKTNIWYRKEEKKNSNQQLKVLQWSKEFQRLKSNKIIILMTSKIQTSTVTVGIRPAMIPIDKLK